MQTKEYYENLDAICEMVKNAKVLQWWMSKSEFPECGYASEAFINLKERIDAALVALSRTKI